MRFAGICIETGDAPRLARFYEIVLQQRPEIDGSHYAFDKIAVYDPGGVRASAQQSFWLMFNVSDLDAQYARLLREIPDIMIIAPPERKPWGAYSFWFSDPDGNKISIFQQDE